jgi:hypothetical protein
MADDVDLIGSRVSVMRLACDCLRCTNTVAVPITDGKGLRWASTPRPAPAWLTRLRGEDLDHRGRGSSPGRACSSLIRGERRFSTADRFGSCSLSKTPDRVFGLAGCGSRK